MYGYPAKPLEINMPQFILTGQFMNMKNTNSYKRFDYAQRETNFPFTFHKLCALVPSWHIDFIKR